MKLYKYVEKKKTTIEVEGPWIMPKYETNQEFLNQISILRSFFDQSKRELFAYLMKVNTKKLQYGAISINAIHLNTCLYSTNRIH